LINCFVILLKLMKLDVYCIQWKFEFVWFKCISFLKCLKIFKILLIDGWFWKIFIIIRRLLPFVLCSRRNVAQFWYANEQNPSVFQVLFSDDVFPRCFRPVLHTFSSDEHFKTGLDYTQCCFSPDRQFCSAGSHDGAVFVWNVDTGKVEACLEKKHEWGIFRSFSIRNFSFCSWQTICLIFIAYDGFVLLVCKFGLFPIFWIVHLVIFRKIYRRIIF